jgi:hypothetical protein
MSKIESETPEKIVLKNIVITFNDDTSQEDVEKMNEVILALSGICHITYTTEIGTEVVEVEDDDDEQT